MPKKYVIEVTNEETQKGKKVLVKKYFVAHTLKKFHVHQLTGDPDNAKTYESRAEALGDWRKYFNRWENAKVVIKPNPF